MYFEHKRVETGPNCSQELAIFLKCHMPLSKSVGKNQIYQFHGVFSNKVFCLYSVWSERRIDSNEKESIFLTISTIGSP